MRVMALDVGKLRIGVAITDHFGYTAQPLLTVWRRSRGEDVRNLLRLIRRHGASHVVVGNPLHLSGEVSAWGIRVKEFADELQNRCGVSCEMWDERLTSVAAHEILNESGYGTRNREGVIDQVAAVLILESWMHAREVAAISSRTYPEAAPQS